MRVFLAAALLAGVPFSRAAAQVVAPILKISPLAGLSGPAGAAALGGFQSPALAAPLGGLSAAALPLLGGPALRVLPGINAVSQPTGAGGVTAVSVRLPGIAAPEARLPIPLRRGVSEVLRPVRGNGARESRNAGPLSSLFDGGRLRSQKGELDISDFRVPGNLDGPVDLSRIDASLTPGFKNTGKSGNNGSKKAVKALAQDIEKLDELQRKLYAEGKRSVLIVLQAMDTGGKDGTIRYVLGPLNPQGVRVSSFKKPTALEIAKGFLWRIRRALPGAGMMGVFNRSQYEDILVPSVYGTRDAAVIENRYKIINDFEKKLADSGTVVLKFFLHVSKDEQKRRLQERLDDPAKNWKFSKADLESRARWDDFQKTYGRVLSRTSTPWAPWYLIPANNKWFRNALIGRILRETMESLNLSFPQPEQGLADVVIPD